MGINYLVFFLGTIVIAGILYLIRERDRNTIKGPGLVLGPIQQVPNEPGHFVQGIEKFNPKLSGDAAALVDFSYGASVNYNHHAGI